MSVEAEAHKVIAISLGKIANSRLERGGPKLYKNLLVANLIEKARVLVIEDEHETEEARDQEERELTLSTSRVERENLIEEEEEHVLLDVGREEFGANNDLSLGCVEQGCDEIRGNKWDENNKENRPTNSSVNTAEIVECSSINTTQPLKCLKRRNETEEENGLKRYRSNDQLNNWREEDDLAGCLATEYTKVHFVLSVELCEGGGYHGNGSSGGYHGGEDETTVAMETEQISSLASVFSSGFHGLGSNGDGVTTATSCSQQAGVLTVSFQENKPVAAV